MIVDGAEPAAAHARSLHVPMRPHDRRRRRNRDVVAPPRVIIIFQTSTFTQHWRRIGKRPQKIFLNHWIAIGEAVRVMSPFTLP